MNSRYSLDRRDFTKSAVLGGVTLASGGRTGFAADSGRRIRTGVIGCGSVSHQYLPQLTRSPFVEVVSLCDIKPERARKQAEKFNVAHHYPHIDAMLAGVPFDFLIDLTDMQQHEHLNRRGLEAGKHVWSEKPIANTLAAGQELLRLARERKLRLWGAPITVQSPQFAFMARQLAAGKLGRVAAASCPGGHHRVARIVRDGPARQAGLHLPVADCDLRGAGPGVSLTPLLQWHPCDWGLTREFAARLSTAPASGVQLPRLGGYVGPQPGPRLLSPARSFRVAWPGRRGTTPETGQSSGAGGLVSMARVQILGKLRRRHEHVRIQAGGIRIVRLHRAQLGELKPFAGRRLLLPAQDSGQAVLQRQQALAALQLGGQVATNATEHSRLNAAGASGQELQAPAVRGQGFRDAALSEEHLAACALPPNRRSVCQAQHDRRSNPCRSRSRGNRPDQAIQQRLPNRAC
jgi:hypothetical protein